MNFYSLNKIAPNVTFKDVVIKGLAPDKGLYFPEKITPLSKAFFDEIEKTYSFTVYSIELTNIKIVKNNSICQIVPSVNSSRK